MPGVTFSPPRSLTLPTQKPRFCHFSWWDNFWTLWARGMELYVGLYYGAHRTHSTSNPLSTLSATVKRATGLVSNLRMMRLCILYWRPPVWHSPPLSRHSRPLLRHSKTTEPHGSLETHSRSLYGQFLWLRKWTAIFSDQISCKEVRKSVWYVDVVLMFDLLIPYSL